MKSQSGNSVQVVEVFKWDYAITCYLGSSAEEFYYSNFIEKEHTTRLVETVGTGFLIKEKLRKCFSQF